MSALHFYIQHQSSPVWFGTSNTNFNKLSRFQNKILSISLRQIHRDYHTYNNKLPLATGALLYDIGRASIHPLKPRLLLLKTLYTENNSLKTCNCVKPNEADLIASPF